MNHPSIGGEEEEPQTKDVPKTLLGDIISALFPAYHFKSWWWNLGGKTLPEVLAAVPPGWMKTEQGWVQMEREGTDHSDSCPDPDICEEGPASRRCIGVGVYRVKQPSENG